MRNAPSRPLLPVVLLLLTAAPASAHDWRAARAEYDHDLNQARAQIRLDGCPLLSAVENQRLMTNQQILETYNRRIRPPYGPPAWYGIPARPLR